MSAKDPPETCLENQKLAWKIMIAEVKWLLTLGRKILVQVSRLLHVHVYVASQT